MRRTVPLILAAAASCGSAQTSFFAQATGAPVGLNYALTWQEADPTSGLPIADPNGLLEPGEAALIRLTIGLTHPVLTPVTWDPAIVGGTGSGIIRGILEFSLNLVGTGGARGNWDHLHVDPIMDLFTGSGTSSSGGAVLANIGGGQLPTSQSVNPTNPWLNVWTGVWSPESFLSRTVTFQSTLPTDLTIPLFTAWPTGAVVRDAVQTSTVLVGALDSHYNSLQIPIVPAPGAAGALLIAGGLCTRGRRRP